MANWRWVDRGDQMDVLGHVVARHELDHPGSLPDLRLCAKLCAAIDWGGLDDSTQFSSLAVLLADEHGCETWYQLRQQVRGQYLPDGRRLSYKTLSDRVRQRALPAFLVAADEIPGLLFTVLVDRQIRTLTSEPDLPARVDFAGAVFGRDDYRRLETTVQFVGFLLAGLSKAGQPGQVLLDEDNIVANRAQQSAVCKAFSLAMKDRLPHMLGAWTVSDAACARDRLLVEDLLAVVDLAAGALADLASNEPHLHDRPAGGDVLADPSALKRKTRAILSWLGLADRALKRLALVIRKDRDDERFVTAQIVNVATPPTV